MIVVTYMGLNRFNDVPEGMSFDEIQRTVVPAGMKFVVAKTWTEAKDKIWDVMESNRPNPGTIDVMDELPV